MSIALDEYQNWLKSKIANIDKSILEETQHLSAPLRQGEETDRDIVLKIKELNIKKKHIEDLLKSVNEFLSSRVLTRTIPGGPN